jgi:hypothetical protein
VHGPALFQTLDAGKISAPLKGVNAKSARRSRGHDGDIAEFGSKQKSATRGMALFQTEGWLLDQAETI